jgi:uncharacterized pyridoxal phosphate-dependent enzyme
MKQSQSLLEELGIIPVVNAAGTVTVLGGCLVHDEVLDAARQMAKIFVDMNSLHEKIGAFVAELVGSEAAYVTSGAAAGLVLSVGACMTKGDANLMHKLPCGSGIIQNEVIVQKLHRNMYDHNLEVGGASIREIGSEEKTIANDLRKAISQRTAVVVYFAYDPQNGVLPLSEVIALSHERGIPVIVDAAAELPPVENLTKYLKMGADIVLFSGGKDIGAPNDTGVILGKRELVNCCKRLGPQSYEPYGTGRRVYIGRPMKTSKEDIVAFAVAIKRYIRTDHKARLSEWEKKTEFMIERLSKSSKIKVKKTLPGVPHNRPVSIPRVEIEILTQKTAIELLDALAKLNPPVYAYALENKLFLNPQCLKDGEEQIVVDSLLKLLPNQ